ncbi:uncharacterized protein N7446_014177 [Penicillium canescens]|uniref:uncharacterized protein n=1 Tax=Penicillium canescens TaxID=5083 RepID=UPI0026E0EFC6|nr:uncharacterized protein N7446_014177 [Penicillium canescens]KAJ6038897.1 hypothetical protein N7446_014177 [Penicillium canescens]
MLSLFILLHLGVRIAHGYPSPVHQQSAETPPSLFLKSLSESNETVFTPYKSLDYGRWKPDSTVYDGVSMVEKHAAVDGKSLTYQDFDIPALTTEQIRKYLMSTPEFFNSHGKLSYTLEDVEKYRHSLMSADHNMTIAVPSRYAKRILPHTTDVECEFGSSSFCIPECRRSSSRAVIQSTNPNVYGDYHYESGALCGTGSISKSVSVTDASGVNIGGSDNIPGLGKGWTGALTKFLSTFGLSTSHNANTVTTTISYSGTCGPHNVCFLWERPHFTVDKGVIITQEFDIATNKACGSPSVTPFEAHIMHEDSDAGGAGMYLSISSVLRFCFTCFVFPALLRH